MSETKTMAKKKHQHPIFTPQHAQAIIDAHDIKDAFDGGEEEELLKENNPELFEAYLAIIRFSEGKSEQP